MNFVSSSIYKRVAKLAKYEGLDQNLINDNLVNNTLLEKDYFLLDDLFILYELGDIHLNDGFPVRVGQALTPEDYRTLGLSWKTVWKAKDILLRLMRFLVLITNKGEFELLIKGSNTHFILNRPVHRKGQAISNEVTFIMIVNMIRTVTDNTINPIKVDFKHSSSCSLDHYTNFFNAEVSFNQNINAIYFNSSDLETPSIKADKSIHHFILERLEEEKKGIEKQSNLVVTDIENLIRDALPSGIPSITDIGKHLGMSRRTLSRRLSNYNLSFRELIKQTQESIAKDLLQNQDLSIGEIAFQSGFSEQTAFNRAFKRWTGQSPSDFRKNH